MTEYGEQLVLFRLDATGEIGSGHAMRCLTIAAALEEKGASVAFVVSCAESGRFLENRGATVFVVGGDPFLLDASDAQLLIDICERLRATAVLIDTYGAYDDFFARLTDAAPRGLTVAAIDDMYSSEHGLISIPRERSCDIVINYDFLATGRGYDGVYGCNGADKQSVPLLLLGPSYAPIRKSFKCDEERSFDIVRRILITSGSTNPGRTLERMIAACSSAVFDEAIEIDVIVGALAKYSRLDIKDENVTIRTHGGVRDLSPFMHEADILVSAGGSTLYEAACAGIPAIAIPIVENQIQNVEGYVKLGLGIGVRGGINWAVDDLRDAVERLAGDGALRAKLSESSRRAVDGDGAKRIAAALCKISGEF